MPMRFLLPLLLIGCAPLTEDEIADREYRWADEHNLYLERKAACIHAGGIWLTTFHEGRGKPNIHELRRAQCVTDIWGNF